MVKARQHTLATTISESSDEEKIVCLHVVTPSSQPVMPVNQFSATIPNCKELRLGYYALPEIIKNKVNHQRPKGDNCLKSYEMTLAEHYLIRYLQIEVFRETMSQFRNSKPLSKSNKLILFLPFVDEDHLLRVGGRTRNSQLPYSSCHPLIILEMYNRSI